MSTPTQFMHDVLAMWTEPQSEARRIVIEARFTDDVRFYDPDGAFAGHEGLETFSASLRQRFPGARFALASEPEVAGNGFRAFWNFGPPEHPNAATGMDFVIWNGEHASALYAFVNPPPQPH